MGEPIAAHVRGAVVLVDDVAPRLALMLRAAARQAERNGARLPADLAEVLRVVNAAAAAVTARKVPRPEPDSVPPLPSGGSAAASSRGEGPISAAEVARRAGCSTRYIRKAAAQERLHGHLGRGGWEFAPTAVDEWLRRRTHGSRSTDRLGH